MGEGQSFPSMQEQNTNTHCISHIYCQGCSCTKEVDKSWLWFPSRTQATYSQPRWHCYCYKHSAGAIYTTGHHVLLPIAVSLRLLRKSSLSESAAQENSCSWWIGAWVCKRWIHQPEHRVQQGEREGEIAFAGSKGRALRVLRLGLCISSAWIRACLYICICSCMSGAA